jgi:hypothetical protein
MDRFSKLKRTWRILANGLSVYPCRGHAWPTNVLEFVQAVFFVFLIWTINSAVTKSREGGATYADNQHPTPVAVAPIPTCESNIYLRVGG